MDAAAIITIVLAVVGGLGALAYKDPAGYRRLFRLVKTPTTIISNFAAGVFSGAVLVGIGHVDPRTVMFGSGAVGLAVLGFSIAYIFFAWLRSDFASYLKDRERDDDR